MPKSVLGDDPFSAPGGAESPEEERGRAGSDSKPAEGGRPGDGAARGRSDSKKPAAKKPAAKKPAAKKPSAKKPSAKKPSAKKPSAKKPPADEPSTRPAAKRSSDEDTHSAPAGRSAEAKRTTVRPPDGATAARAPRGATQPPPPFDGATARRAARATASFRDMERAAPSSPPGAGLDDAATRLRPQPSLNDELRRVEQQVTGKLRGAAELQRGQRSLIDRMGELMRPETYRNLVSALMMRNRSDRVDDFGMDPVYAEQWRPLLQFLYESYWRVETSGMENIPDHGRAVIVSNHSGTLPYDSAMIMHAVRFNHPAHRDVRPLVEDFVFHFPFLGVALNRIGCVRACQENAERLLDTEQVVAVFPEGIKGIGKLYRDRYQLQRFGRGGFVKLALKKSTPIIPTAVIGAEEIYPMLAKITWLAKYLGIPYIPVTPTFPWLGPAGALPAPSKWRIRFGEPLDLARQYGPDAHQDRILVNRLADQVRSTIQGMVDELLTSRRSIVFG